MCTRRTNRFLLLCFIVLFPVTLASAAGAGEQVEGGGDPTPGGVTLTDARGEDVVVRDTSRVVTLGSAVTEIVHALGRGDRVVGADASSVYPPEGLEGVPRTGYVRDLSAEGVISLDPTLIIGSTDVGPPEVITQVEDAGIPVFIVPEEDSFEGAKTRVELVGRLLDADTEAEGIIAEINRDAEQARELAGDLPDEERVRVMFVYARGVGSLNVSGTDTSADAIIRLAGGQNAVTDYQGYRPLTAEAAVAINPDVLLFLDGGLASLGGVESLADVPGLAETSALQNGRVLSFDAVYLLGFGPRVGRAAVELAQALYPDGAAGP